MNVAAGNSPKTVVLADFNGDGKLDMAVADAYTNRQKEGGIAVLLGNGDGTFQPLVQYLSGEGTLYLVSADYNGDGNLDLAVTASNGITVLPGNGDGTFGSPISSGVSFYNGEMVVADLNGDGIPDIVVGGQALLGNGDGTFREVGPNLGGLFTAVADFNGDGKLDIAESTSFGIAIFLGNGDGTFNTPGAYFFAGDCHRQHPESDHRRFQWGRQTGSGRRHLGLEQYQHSDEYPRRTGLPACPHWRLTCYRAATVRECPMTPRATRRR